MQFIEEFYCNQSDLYQHVDIEILI